MYVSRAVACILCLSSSFSSFLKMRVIPFIFISYFVPFSLSFSIPFIWLITIQLAVIRCIPIRVPCSFASRVLLISTTTNEPTKKNIHNFNFYAQNGRVREKNERKKIYESNYSRNVRCYKMLLPTRQRLFINMCMRELRQTNLLLRLFFFFKFTTRVDFAGLIFGIDV